MQVTTSLHNVETKLDHLISTFRMRRRLFQCQLKVQFIPLACLIHPYIPKLEYLSYTLNMLKKKKKKKKKKRKETSLKDTTQSLNRVPMIPSGTDFVPVGHVAVNKNPAPDLEGHMTGLVPKEGVYKHLNSLPKLKPHASFSQSIALFPTEPTQKALHNQLLTQHKLKTPQTPDRLGNQPIHLTSHATTRPR
jgi:hypothetical protein